MGPFQGTPEDAPGGAGLSGHHRVNVQAYLLPRTCLRGSKELIPIAWEGQSEVSVGWREPFQGCLQSSAHNEPGSFH